MGNGMAKVLPGLYVGNLRDARDKEQLERHRITHVVSVLDNARPVLHNLKYLCVHASDIPEQNLLQYFRKCIDFIHEARVNGGHVLIHCLAGVSRSVTVTVAYTMTVSNFSWREALKAVKCARHVANPNLGFQRQLQEFDVTLVREERRRLRRGFSFTVYNDQKAVQDLLDDYNRTHHGMDIEHELYPLSYNAYRSRFTSNNRLL